MEKFQQTELVFSRKIFGLGNKRNNRQILNVVTFAVPFYFLFILWEWYRYPTEDKNKTADYRLKANKIIKQLLVANDTKSTASFGV